MTVIAVTMVKNELDVIETTIRHMAAHVDHVIVADNGSTDGTRDVLETLPCETLDDPDPAYYQSFKMTRLAHYAGAQGADWVVPFDADEIWLPATETTIAEQLRRSGGNVAPAWLYDHVVTTADLVGIAPQQAMTYRMRERSKLHKVAARYISGMVIEMGNHQVTYPKNQKVRIDWDVLQVRHYPIRSPRQFARKARQGSAALALTDLPDDIGRHWRDWGELSDTQLHHVFSAHWRYTTDDPRIMYDPAGLSGI